MRNRYRSFLTGLTIFLGAALLTIALSFLNGLVGSFESEGAKASGHVRILTEMYERRAALHPIYENIADVTPVVDSLQSVDGVQRVYPRIQLGVLGLLGEEDEEGGEDVVGQLMAAPVGYFDEVLGLREQVLPGGTFFDGGKEQGMIGHTLARQLGVEPGDVAYFLGRTQDGSLSPFKITVTGLVDTGNGVFDKQVYVNLDLGRWVADIPEGALDVLVYGEDRGDAEAIRGRVESRLAELDHANPLVTQLWSEQEPFASLAQVLTRIAGGLSGVIVFVAALGVLNTMLMSVMERTGEIGVMRAMGLTLPPLLSMFILEALAIAVVAGVLGAGLGSVVALALETTGVDLGVVADDLPSTLPANRVLRTHWAPQIAAASVALSCVMAVLGSLVPALRAIRIQPVQAMRFRR